MRVCYCTGHLSNPGGICCMDLFNDSYKTVTTTTLPYMPYTPPKHTPFQQWRKKEEEPKKVEKETIPNIFEFIAVSPKKRDDIRHIKNVLHELNCWIQTEIEDNEYRSHGIKALEEAAMWLNKSISRSMKK